MPTPMPEHNDPNNVQEVIKTAIYSIAPTLGAIYVFSEKGLNLLEKWHKIKSSRVKREEKIEALAEKMETMLKQMQAITTQQHEATVNHRLQLMQNERWERQITELERGIEECQKEIAYLRGKTEKP